jgi:hypothetical protein
LPRSRAPVNGAFKRSRRLVARKAGRLMTVYSARQTGQGTGPDAVGRRGVDRAALKTGRR